MTSKRFEVDLKDTSIKRGQFSIIVDSLIVLGFFVMGLIGFLTTFQAKLFDRMIILGFVAVIVKELISYYNFDKHKVTKQKIRRVAMSAGLLRLKNTSGTSLLLDTREVLDAPKIIVTDTEKYLQIEFYANGCPNPDNSYRLQKRLTEEFRMPVELVDDYDHATYRIYKSKQRGRKLNDNDFR